MGKKSKKSPPVVEESRMMSDAIRAYMLMGLSYESASRQVVLDREEMRLERGEVSE